MRQTARYRFDRSGFTPFALILLSLFAAGGVLASAQSPSDKPAQQPPKPAEAPGKHAEDAAKPAESSQGEVVTRDSNPTFKVRVNLVLVRVVVRDSEGKTVDNLKKEDFLLFDNRKAQAISSFSVETPLSHPVPVVTLSDRAEPGAAEPAVPALPQRFVSLLFDDIHISMEDAV